MIQWNIFVPFLKEGFVKSVKIRLSFSRGIIVRPKSFFLGIALGFAKGYIKTLRLLGVSPNSGKFTLLLSVTNHFFRAFTTSRAHLSTLKMENENCFAKTQGVIIKGYSDFSIVSKRAKKVLVNAGATRKKHEIFTNIVSMLRLSLNVMWNFCCRWLSCVSSANCWSTCLWPMLMRMKTILKQKGGREECYYITYRNTNRINCTIIFINWIKTMFFFLHIFILFLSIY